VAFSGGELRIHRLGAKPGDFGHDIEPRQGRLVVFPSWWPHEVLKVRCPSGNFADSRFSVNCWIHRQRPSG
jgi:Rps23 Pro-64 3,4-dihydroxylase Tpa1-like proline 4-hydroxylase